ncbi:MAG: PilT/PilU family type 4a pilus ATPase [Ruminococcaceae bacterium]|nr:PilT/PilU family type 4a pilus ATPase [Oscillospiraceae bacterium]
MNMNEYLSNAVEKGASDVFIIAGSALSCKIRGLFCNLDEKKLLPPDTKRMIADIYEMADRSMDGLEAKGDDDFSFAVSGLARFRVSTYRQRGSFAAVIRVVSFSIPDPRSLGIPEEVMKLSDVHHGLILCTGTAGSGKSTTQACIIDKINHTRACHVITLEDPIEYLHRNDKSIISQREIAIDTVDCLTGLRACLRQSPDVILLGEMRDPETIRTAMTAAETGHTVFATLHTKGTANCIDRISDAFPAEQQGQIRIQLASVLHTVISQQLVPDVKGELIPAFEILHANHAARNLIREGKTHQLANVITTGAAEGMISMDQSLYHLYQEKKITKEQVLAYSENPEQLARRL